MDGFWNRRKLSVVVFSTEVRIRESGNPPLVYQREDLKNLLREANSPAALHTLGEFKGEGECSFSFEPNDSGDLWWVVLNGRKAALLNSEETQELVKLFATL